MITASISAVKLRFAELLDRVAAGERVIVTRRGRAVAMLVPYEPSAERSVAENVEAMLRERDASGPRLGGGLSLRQLIEEGRR